MENWLVHGGEGRGKIKGGERRKDRLEIVERYTMNTVMRKTVAGNGKQRRGKEKIRKATNRGAAIARFGERNTTGRATKVNTHYSAYLSCSGKSQTKRCDEQYEQHGPGWSSEGERVSA